MVRTPLPALVSFAAPFVPSLMVPERVRVVGALATVTVWLLPRTTLLLTVSAAVVAGLTGAEESVMPLPAVLPPVPAALMVRALPLMLVPPPEAAPVPRLRLLMVVGVATVAAP